MNEKLACFFAVLILFSGCNNAGKTNEREAKVRMQAKATVVKETLLDSVPSGSGLVFSGNSYYLITDDSPYFFTLDANFQHLQKYRTDVKSTATDYRLAKASKPDFESFTAATIGSEKCLIGFGSGSKSPERDVVLLAALENLEVAKTYKLTAFYTQLKAEANLTETELNIEGAAIVNDQLYLLNRGRNLLIQTSWPAFIASIQNGRDKFSLKFHEINLPQHNKITVGFSGACQLGNENKLLFCASVENTQNWVADGEILGSYIGILDLNAPEKQPLETFVLLTNASGKPAIEKVESVEFSNQEANGRLNLFALTDDDLGNSKILEIRLSR